MKGLEFFRKTNCKHLYSLASFHSPHSLTWSWILSIDLRRHNQGNSWRPVFHAHRNNNGLQWMLRIPFVCLFQWHRQQPMWYRDMYNRQYERQMQSEGLLLLPDDHPNKVYRRPPRVEGVGAAADGGRSLH